MMGVETPHALNNDEHAAPATDQWLKSCRKAGGKHHKHDFQASVVNYVREFPGTQ